MALGLLRNTELTDEQFARISELVKGLCGINLHEGKKELVKARLNKRLRTLGLRDFEQYLDRVRQDATGDELTTMLDSLSTNLTSFFREPQHFDHLRRVVLPALTARAQGRRRHIRIWSAGCSSGEEPYSIAIFLREHVPDLDRWDAAILATDLSTRVLARAREGIYDAQRLADMPASWVGRHFDEAPGRGGSAFRVKPAVQRLVTFARLNLMGPWPMRGPFDVIFCRNVMIYFDKPTQGQLVGRYCDILAPGGVLLLGHSESLTGIRHRLRYVQPTIYQKPPEHAEQRSRP